MQPRRRGSIILPAALLVIALVASSATAGWLDFGRKKSQLAEPGDTVRFDRHRPLEFAAGMLVIDGFGRYRVGQASLIFPEDLDDDRDTVRPKLALGQSYVVTGLRMGGGSMLVTKIKRVRPHPLALANKDADEPSAGEITERVPQ